MTKADSVWIKSMEWCAKYWGCHQMPERSFFIRGYQMPVCARCFGIMLGEAMAVPSAFFLSLNVFFLLVLMVPMALDGGIQYKTGYRSTNPRRFVTGFLFGFAFVYSVMRGILSLVSKIP